MWNLRGKSGIIVLNKRTAKVLETPRRSDDQEGLSFMDATSDSTTKTCSRCKQALQATTDYFPKNRTEKDGLGTYCKACHRAYAAEWRRSHNVNLYRVDLPDELRQCGKCSKVKPATREYFSTNKNGKGGLQNICKDCAASRQRKYRQDNPERVRANEKNRDPEKRRISSLRSQQRNGKRNREIYAERHPERVRASAQKQRAKRKQAPGEYTGQDLLALFKGQAGNCWWCGCKIKGKFEVDHRIPLSRGGTNDVGNIVISCMPCNRSKHDKLPSEWNGRLL